MNLLAHGYHRELRLARAITDLEGSERIQAAHLAEATHFAVDLGDEMNRKHDRAQSS